MPVLMCCAKEDRSRVEPLIEALRRDRRRVDVVGLSDRQGSLPGRARMHVDMHTAVIVVWTRTSVTRVQMAEAAQLARDRGALVPVMFDPVQPPDSHELPMPVDAIGWGGDQAAPALAQIRARVAAKEQAVVDVPMPQGIPLPDAEAAPALPAGAPAQRPTGRPEDGWRGAAPDRIRRPAGPPPPLRRAYGEDPPTDPDGSSYRTWDPATDIPEAVRPGAPTTPDDDAEAEAGSSRAWLLVLALAGLAGGGWWAWTHAEVAPAAPAAVDSDAPADTDAAGIEPGDAAEGVDAADDADAVGAPDDAPAEGTVPALDDVDPPTPDDGTPTPPAVDPAAVPAAAETPPHAPAEPDPVVDRMVSAGWLAVQQGRQRDAITLFQRALDRDPHHPSALQGVGVSELALGRVEAAHQHLCAARAGATGSQAVDLDALLAAQAIVCDAPEAE